jgi:hypothetical protein
VKSKLASFDRVENVTRTLWKDLGTQKDASSFDTVVIPNETLAILPGPITAVPPRPATNALLARGPTFTHRLKPKEMNPVRAIGIPLKEQLNFE